MTHRLLLIALLFACIGSAASAQTPAPSWRQRAENYAAARALDSAEYFYARWVEADPGDENSWYNLACVRSLRGETAAALDAFDAAVAAGWSDTEWPLQDPDLTLVRAEKRFADAIERARTLGRREGPKDYLRRFVEMKSVGTYIVMLPPDYETTTRRYPLLVILHGSGSTELDHGRLADQIGRDGVIMIAVRAPYASAGATPDRLGWTAWPQEVPDSTNPLLRTIMPGYADWIASCMDDAREHYRVDDRPAMVLGHSQGAAFSLITAAMHPGKVRAAFAYAGYFPAQLRTPDRLEILASSGTRFTLVHGRDDTVVPPGESSEADELFRSRGIPVELTLLDSTTHGINRQVLDLMKKWKEREVGR